MRIGVVLRCLILFFVVVVLLVWCSSYHFSNLDNMALYAVYSAAGTFVVCVTVYLSAVAAFSHGLNDHIIVSTPSDCNMREGEGAGT